MKVFFFFATLQEAQATLQRFSAIREKKHPFCFRFDQGYIICTGIGLRNAFVAAMNASRENALWINVGVAGSLNRHSCVGQVVHIDQVGLLRFSETANKQAPRGNPICLRKEAKTALFSSRTPIYYPIPTQFSASFVDMEGYAIAYVAKLYKIPVAIVKAISDICSSTSKIAIAKNLPILSQTLARYCERLMQCDARFF